MPADFLKRECDLEIAELEATTPGDYVIRVRPTESNGCDWSAGSYSFTLGVTDPDTEVTTRTFALIQVQ